MKILIHLSDGIIISKVQLQSYLWTGEVESYLFISSRSLTLAQIIQPLQVRCVLSVPVCQSQSPRSCHRPSVSGPVLRPSVSLARHRPSVSGAACSHKTAFKGKRSSPCLRSPSAMSVPLFRDFCLPGAIWSQAEGGMSPANKSQTGGGDTPTHARSHHSRVGYLKIHWATF